MNKEPSFPQIAVSLVLILMPLSQRRMSQNYKPTWYSIELFTCERCDRTKHLHHGKILTQTMKLRRTMLTP